MAIHRSSQIIWSLEASMSQADMSIMTQCAFSPIAVEVPSSVWDFIGIKNYRRLGY